MIKYKIDRAIISNGYYVSRIVDRHGGKFWKSYSSVFDTIEEAKKFIDDIAHPFVPLEFDENGIQVG